MKNEMKQPQKLRSKIFRLPMRSDAPPSQQVKLVKITARNEST